MTVCRYHGARKPETIRKGASHPQYRHGQETLEAKAERSKVLAELREIEALSFAYGRVPKEPRAGGVGNLRYMLTGRMRHVVGAIGGFVNLPGFRCNALDWTYIAVGCAIMSY